MNVFRISCADLKSFSGELLYLHGGKSLPSGAFEKSNGAAFDAVLPRPWGVTDVTLIIYSEDGQAIRELPAVHRKFDLDSDVFRAEIDSLALPVGLYFAKLRLRTVAGELYGLKGDARRVCIGESIDGNAFQFSLVEFKHPAPERYLGGLIYHVFVDRFARGGNVPVREDAVLRSEWEDAIPEYPEYPGAHLENNTFFGGTLYGVIDKLDYIKSLGTTLIYLSPIFEAYSNHKYDTADYMQVDRMFGGEEALKLLIAEADRRGIGIILDGVFNHTGSDSVYFNKKGRYPSIGAYQSKDSPYYDWYDFKSHPDSYTCWWNIVILPRINPSVKSCADYFVGDGGVIEKYASLGIAGMRLDVADELSDGFIADIKSRLAKHNDSSVLFGEVWEDASNKIAYGRRKTYYLGEELDGVMNYPLRLGIIDFVRKKNCDALRYALTEVTFNAPKRVRDMQMNILGTHDTERIITVLAAAPCGGRKNSELAVARLSDEERLLGIKRLKLAYTLLATLPGIPTVYYGDEAGLEGYRDPFNRRPFPWGSINAELYAHYKGIGELRRSTDVYADGELEVLHMSDELVVIKRYKKKRAYITVANNSDKCVHVKLSRNSEGVFSGETGNLFSVAPESAEVFKTYTASKFEIV